MHPLGSGWSVQCSPICTVQCTTLTVHCTAATMINFGADYSSKSINLLQENRRIVRKSDVIQQNDFPLELKILKENWHLLSVLSGSNISLRFNCY